MEQTLEIIGTLVGLLYLWLEYRASIYLWIAGIIMPAIYIFVYYNAGLYADFGINIYYLGAAIYGWMMWKYGAFLRRTILKRKIPDMENQQQELPITFTTALSIVGMWMLARKYVEQWWAWIGVDAVSTGLYIYKGLDFTAALYGLYTIIAIFGYFKWKKLMKKEADL